MAPPAHAGHRTLVSRVESLREDGLGEDPVLLVE